MATKTATKATLLDRTFIQRIGVTVYTFKSSRSDDRYIITADATGDPDPATHQDCIGYAQHKHCCHMDVVLGWKATDAVEIEIAECTAAVNAAEQIIKWSATCDYCGRNHASSNCSL